MQSCLSCHSCSMIQLSRIRMAACRHVRPLAPATWHMRVRYNAIFLPIRGGMCDVCSCPIVFEWLCTASLQHMSEVFSVCFLKAHSSTGRSWQVEHSIPHQQQCCCCCFEFLSGIHLPGTKMVDMSSAAVKVETYCRHCKCSPDRSCRKSLVLTVLGFCKPAAAM